MLSAAKHGITPRQFFHHLCTIFTTYSQNAKSLLHCDRFVIQCDVAAACCPGRIWSAAAIFDIGNTRRRNVHPLARG